MVGSLVQSALCRDISYHVWDGVYVTVNLYNQVICILPDVFS